MNPPLSSAPSDPSRVYYSSVAAARFNSYHSTASNDLTVPILQASVDFLPSADSQNILEDITQCQTNQHLHQLASSIHTGLLMPLLSRGPAPHVSLSSRFPAEKDIEEISASIEGVSTTADQSWLKRV